MARIPNLLAGLALSLALASPGSAAAPVALWRLDCGTFVTKGLVNGCYLIRHGDTYMLWEAGFGAELVGHPMERPVGKRNELAESLADQLARLGLSPADISILAISHPHWDHVGQAAAFPGAKLLVGREDWPALEAGRFGPWLSGGGVHELVDGDRDVFGDGSVAMLATPGHTPGHHSLLVRLAGLGPVLLSGDLYHAQSQRGRGAVPEAARFEALARSLKATVIIQHEAQDVAKLPAFPEAAE